MGEYPMSIRTIRAGAAQLFMSLDVESNLEKMKAFSEEAANRGVEILLFPECCLSGYAPADWRADEVFPYSSENLLIASKELHRIAGSYGVALVYGTAWEDSVEGWMNRAYVTNAVGEVVGHVDKNS